MHSDHDPRRALPHPLALLYDRLDVHDPGERLLAVLAFAEGLARYLALVLVADAAASGAPATALKRRVTFKGFGDLLAAIELCLTDPVPGAAPFMPEVKELYGGPWWKAITALKEIRNDHAHWRLGSSRDEALALLRERQEQIGTLVTGIAFLDRYPMGVLRGVHTGSDGTASATWVRCHGLSPRGGSILLANVGGIPSEQLLILDLRSGRGLTTAPFFALIGERFVWLDRSVPDGSGRKLYVCPVPGDPLPASVPELLYDPTGALPGGVSPEQWRASPSSLCRHFDLNLDDGSRRALEAASFRPVALARAITEQAVAPPLVPILRDPRQAGSPRVPAASPTYDPNQEQYRFWLRVVNLTCLLIVAFIAARTGVRVLEIAAMVVIAVWGVSEWRNGVRGPPGAARPADLPTRLLRWSDTLPGRGALTVTLTGLTVLSGGGRLSEKGPPKAVLRNVSVSALQAVPGLPSGAIMGGGSTSAWRTEVHVEVPSPQGPRHSAPGPTGGLHGGGLSGRWLGSDCDHVRYLVTLGPQDEAWSGRYLSAYPGLARLDLREALAENVSEAPSGAFRLAATDPMPCATSLRRRSRVGRIPEYSLTAALMELQSEDPDLGPGRVRAVVDWVLLRGSPPSIVGMITCRLTATGADQQKRLDGAIRGAAGCALRELDRYLTPRGTTPRS